MRRKDREVTDIAQIQQMLDECATCRLAMVDNGKPYVIPLSYAYTLDRGALTLYFHSAKSGRKIYVLRANNDVCFEISREGALIYDRDDPCESGFAYSCVIGFGAAEFVDDADEKCAALSLLMKHQAHADISFTPEQAESVCVFKVVSNDYTGKRKTRKDEA